MIVVYFLINFREMCFMVKVVDFVVWKGRIFINFRGSWFDMFYGYYILVINYFFMFFDVLFVEGRWVVMFWVFEFKMYVF